MHLYFIHATESWSNLKLIYK